MRPALAVLGVVGAIFLYRFNPAEVKGLPVCPFYGITGLYCPGCGTLRGLHLLLRGDLAGALSMNPLAVAGLPFLAYGAWRTWRHARYGEPLPRLLTSPAWGWAFLGILCAYGVLRNLPAFAWLAPG